MKVTNEVFQKMKSDIKAVMDFHNVSGTIGIYSDDILLSIWHRTFQNRYSQSMVKIAGVEVTNPNIDFKENGDRLLERDTKYELYPCGTNDSTLLTAVRKAVNEIVSK